jgi:glycerophosphoryl diester phosphodiesterase
MKNIISFSLLLAIALQCTSQKAVLPELRHRFIVIAHRGDHVKVPENTLAAYENGIRNGVDYVEIDLRTTKDSVLVIMHDATVDRMTNGSGKVSELSYSQIRALKIRDKNDSAISYPVPSFEEVLKTCRNKIHIYLDFKNASVMQSYEMIRKYGMEKQIVVYINSAEQYRQWRSLVPSMPVMLSLPENIRSEEELKNFLGKYPLELLDGDYSDYTPGMLKTAAGAGITVWPDIQSPDESKNWDKALITGFQGLQTDHPEALIEYLKKKGLR